MKRTAFLVLYPALIAGCAIRDISPPVERRLMIIPSNGRESFYVCGECALRVRELYPVKAMSTNPSEVQHLTPIKKDSP